MTEPEAPGPAAGDGDGAEDEAADDGLAHTAAAAVERHDTLGEEDHAALEALVQRIVRQDEAALAELYRRLATRVYRNASRIVRDIGTAEEVVEDVFWQVWRQAPRFDSTRGVVIAWVMKIARSRALDALRASGRNPLLTALDIDDDANMPAAEQGDPPSLLDRANVVDRVQGALSLLDPMRRQLVSLAFERGYSQSEIAEHMGMPLGTVKSNIRRALAAMKTTLENSLTTAPEHRA
jgi:RNA polymerase sigma factor (sigma-70 family)